MSNIKDIINNYGFQSIYGNIVFTNGQGINLANSGHVTFVTD